MRKLRLIGVAVQPRFMLDDGEHLEEIEHPVVVIPAAEWPAYQERFAREVREWQDKLDSEDASEPE